MRYRKLGNTGLEVSEIGFGAEWMERHNEAEVAEVIRRCEEQGINILDCWMCEPNVRTNIGKAIAGSRDRWIIQGHLGSTWQNGQYRKTRDVAEVKKAFEDLLDRLGTDHIELGMIHFVDAVSEWEEIQNSEYLDYVFDLKAKAVIGHIGLSTHNPEILKRAAESGYVEMVLFSVNPAFDMLPASEDINASFADEYDSSLGGINTVRSEAYRICENNGVGITCMKPYAGGRLFKASASPFGTELTPVQCIHYCLTRPAVASVMCGYDIPEHVDAAVAYETSTEAEKDYASVLASAPRHAYSGQCTYCGHCRPCPADIDIAMVNKYYDLAVMQNEAPASVMNHYLDLEHKASECIGCRGCEERCPFGVKVADRMVLSAELFGI